MTTKQEIENARIDNVEQLCELVEKLDYKGNQLYFPNGSNIGSLIEFFNDNPGAIAAGDVKSQISLVALVAKLTELEKRVEPGSLWVQV